MWEAYFHRLAVLARAYLRSVPRGAAAEEDVALSAFASFCRRAERGQFPRLADRNDLWQILYMITVRKAAALARHEGRQARGAGRVPTFTDRGDLDPTRIPGPEPAPELVAEMADQCRHLLGLLGDETLRSVALWKMEGLTNAEIANRLGRVEHTVERKLRTIRSIWAREAEP